MAAYSKPPSSSSSSSCSIANLFPQSSTSSLHNREKPDLGHDPPLLKPINAEVNYLSPNKDMASSSDTKSRGGGEIHVSSMADASIDGMLEITIHHAKDIHNICIYGNQDVYAKFSITHAQDAVYPTQPVRGGGKNPVFNQSMEILISKLDAVLKCEIWMMSAARSYLEDQLLGFVLVPLADLLGKGKHTQDYALSSTDLFHTPAGTVCLSLRFYSRGMDPALLCATARSPEEVVMVLENGHQSISSPMDYNSIEFPDLHIDCENQKLVSDYLKLTSAGDISMHGGEAAPQELYKREYDDMRMAAHHEQELQGASFLQLGSSSPSMGEMDCEMSVINQGDEKCKGENNYSDDGDDAAADSHVDPDANGGDADDDNDDDSPESPSDNTHLSAVEAPSSSPSVNTVTRSSTTEEVIGSKKHHHTTSANVPTPGTTPFYGSGSQATPSPGSVSSAGVVSLSDDKTNGNSDKQESSRGPFVTSLVNISLEPEGPIVQQQQIVDMYMKSMQQFTESLAKMKLPLDLDAGQNCVDLKDTAQAEKKGANDTGKDGHRVFYGSRAFF